jgi:hypothetical protein
MRVPLLVVALTIAAAACRGGSASSPPPAPAAPPAIAAPLVALQLSRVEGMPAGLRDAVVARSPVTVEGEIVNLPLDSSVRVAAKCDPADAEWHLLLPVATVEDSGHWHARAEVPGDNNHRRSCQLMALVVSHRVGNETHDNLWIAQHAQRITDPIQVELLPAASNAPGGSLAIVRVAETQLDSAQPVAVSTAFGIDGTGSTTAQERIGIAARCEGSSNWHVVATTGSSPDGAWHVDSVSLPSRSSPDRPGCTLEAFSSSAEPRVGEEIPAATYPTRVSTRSQVVAILRNPVPLWIDSIADARGSLLYSRSNGALPNLLVLDHTAAAAQLESDPLPSSTRVWQLLRGDDGNWLVFGPAQRMERGRYLLSRPQLTLPGRPQSRRLVTMFIAADEDLTGRALTALDITRVAVGVSVALPIEVAIAGPAPTARVALRSINDVNAGDGAVDAVADTKGRLDAVVDARVPSEAYAVSVGHLDPDSRQWLFHATVPSSGRYRALTWLEPVEYAGTGANSQLVPVIAQALPVEQRLDSAWWAGMVIASGTPVAMRLPRQPWPRLWVRTTERELSRWKSLVTSRVREEATDAMPSLLQALTALLIVAVAVYAWRHRMGLRAIVNARLDARAARRGLDSSHAFLDAIEAQTDGRVLRLKTKWTRRIARARHRFDDIVRSLRETYEAEYNRLKEETGRHDASVALPAWAHAALLTALTVGESAFNLAVFYVFREPAIYTLLMATAVALSIPICAFSVGLWIRRWRAPWLATAIKLVVTIATLGATLVGLNSVRIAYLSTVAPEFVRSHPELSTAFLSLNAIIFVASAMVTFWSHDQKENFAEAKRRVERLRGKAAGLQARIEMYEDKLRAQIERQRAVGRYYTSLYHTAFNRHTRSVNRATPV